ncbi:MAG: hypothetical protein HYV02_06420 [Deltaproteobacteria bacterium]|nr:hypothetical protein [Deltaproteobacteria bacterium]
MRTRRKPCRSTTRTRLPARKTARSIRPITLTIQCDATVADVTGYQQAVLISQRGAFFGDFFSCWLANHPEIERHCPPGTLAFTLNGRAPEMLDLLHDGDHLEFWTTHVRPAKESMPALLH